MASLPYPLCHDCPTGLVGMARMPYPPTISIYPTIHIYSQNIQCAVIAATRPPQKCAMMALGVRSR